MFASLVRRSNLALVTNNIAKFATAPKGNNNNNNNASAPRQRNNASNMKVRPDYYDKNVSRKSSDANVNGGGYKNPANRASPLGQTKENTEDLFEKSRLNSKFNLPHDGNSYFNRLNSKSDVLYFAGTRRVTSTDNTINEASYVFIVRSVDKAQKMILDRIVAFDYTSGMPFEQELNTLVDDSLDKAMTIDMDPESQQLISKTLIKLRGEPWKWHSAVSITRLEKDEENFPDRPDDTMTISRIRFDAESMLAEKVIRQNNETLYTIVDDLKVISPKVFAEKTKQIYDEYTKLMEQQIENAAEEFGDEKAQQITKMAGVEDFKTSTRRK